MSSITVQKLFEEHNPEYGKFGNVSTPKSNRADIHAFLLLDELFPSPTGCGIVASSDYDLIYLNVQTESIDELTSEQVLELTRAGVLYCNESDALYMFT